MSGLLYLVHRLPYPPEKGDKIRSFHLLRYLSARHQVYLGAFIDDPADRAHVDALASWCEGSHFADLSPRTARLRSLAGLVSGEPLTLPYYRDAGLRRWVRGLVDTGKVRAVVAFSSAMARFVPPEVPIKLMDMVDVDSDKWARYAHARSWPLSWLYRREAAKLAAWEGQVAREFDATFLVSRQEAGLLRQVHPEASDRIHWFENGVDYEYFRPDAAWPNPFAADEQAIVFTGAMDYWPNADAVGWFAREALPLIRASLPAVRFYIVGSRPGAAVRELQSLAGVRVTGRVADVRPYLQHAACVVAPLRLARGVQNKVLEAMSMAKAVVASREALEGIQAEIGREVLAGSDLPATVAAVLAACRGEHAELGQRARARILQAYDWNRNLARLDAWLDPSLIH